MTRYRFDQIAENSTAKKKPEESDHARSMLGWNTLDPGTLEVTRWGAEVTPKGDKLLMKKGDVLFGRRRGLSEEGRHSTLRWHLLGSRDGTAPERPMSSIRCSSRFSSAPTYSLTRQYGFPSALFRRRQTGKIFGPWNLTCPRRENNASLPASSRKPRA